MKKFFSIIIAILLGAAAFAQRVPQTVNFSATVRDANNQLLANTPITVRLTVYDGGDGGTPVYCAMHQTTTNANGFMSFQLNRNVYAYCSDFTNTPFDEIPWGNGNYWLYVEYQAQIGAPFESLGYLEITSGFYAFAADRALVAQRLEGFDIDVTDAQDGDILVYNGTTRRWEARRPENIGGGSGENPQYGNGTLNGHDYVDLGLPSGLLWATCNVGSTTPEGYGDFFAWGETTPKENYNLETYQYCNGTANTLTKYCSNSSWGANGFTDNLTTLEASDDAASANWGSGWRMPTQTEMQELIDNCTVTWTPQNGVNGRLFTGSNGNSIFLPAAGYRRGSELDVAGSYGVYWSSSLDTGSPACTWELYFGSDDYDVHDHNGRRYGGPVRPVCVSVQN